MPGLRSARWLASSLLDEAEDLHQGWIVPPLGLPAVEYVGHRPTASVSTHRGSRMPLQILDRAQHQMRIRKRRSRPQQLDHLWRVTELGEPRSEVSHLDRCQPERGTPSVVFAVPPQHPSQRQRGSDHVLDHELDPHRHRLRDETFSHQSGDNSTPLWAVARDASLRRGRPLEIMPALVGEQASHRGRTVPALRGISSMARVARATVAKWRYAVQRSATNRCLGSPGHPDGI